MQLQNNSSVIEKTRNLFLNEAINSPLLFNDLANMEKYISESYSGRSLIELLQNADDALAKRFTIEMLDDETYIVANDGRCFTDDDMLALCRSGASTKTRKSNTIGFRGIGFKSVVNYAAVVHLVSGSIQTTFSRELTKEVVLNASDVPLIRIPHQFAGQKYESDILRLQNQGFDSIFVFESKNHILSEEIRDFDSNCMLFLQSIQNVELTTSQKKTYSVERNQVPEGFWNVNACNGVETDNWLISIPKQQDEKCSVAFKFNGEKVIEAGIKESVIHSFMPTHNGLSMLMKLNGDFSTDPSRTRVVLDDETLNSSEKCATILSNLVISILQSGIDEYGLIEIIKRAKTDPLSQIRGVDANDIIVEQLQKKINEFLYSEISKGKEIFLQPQGITNDDFEKIVNHQNAYGIGNRDQEKIPGLLECMKAFGLKEIPLEKCLLAMKEIECSENTRTTVLVDAINKTRFGMDNDLKQEIMEAKLIKFDSGVKKINDVNSDDLVESTFEGAVSELLTSIADFNAFTKKVGLKEEQLAMNNRAPEILTEHKISNAEVQTKTASFSKKRVIKKWRSVEKNVAAVLELMDDVDYVTDVASQNLGYDLEAVLNDGSRRYYEVKSVNSLGDLISITNNEYSTATQHKENYYLAITCQTDTNIEICFVKNPTKSLSLSKRVTRWEWICNEYEGEVVLTDMAY